MQFFLLMLLELDSLDGPGILLVDLASVQQGIDKDVLYSNIESIDGDNDPKNSPTWMTLNDTYFKLFNITASLIVGKHSSFL